LVKEVLALPEDREELEVLLRLAGAINAAESQEAFLEGFLDLAISHVNAQRGVIFLIEPDGLFKPTAARSIFPKDLQTVKSVAMSVVKMAGGSGDDFWSDNLAEDPRFGSQSAVIHNILSMMAIALVAGKQSLGVLYLDHGERKAAFTERDHRFIRALCDFSAPVLRHFLVQEQLGRENAYLRTMKETPGFDEIVTDTPSMVRILESIPQVARTSASVLIQGESGTGKELVARAIHQNSSRSNKPFLVQNCAAIPDNLFESELFGYKKGSFTGAAADKVGLLDAAQGGTLFLDEIGDLSSGSQAKNPPSPSGRGIPTNWR